MHEKSKANIVLLNDEALKKNVAIECSKEKKSQNAGCKGVEQLRRHF